MRGATVNRPGFKVSNKYRNGLDRLDRMGFEYELFVSRDKDPGATAHVVLRWRSEETGIKLLVHGRGATLHEAFESVGAQVILWAIQADLDSDISTEDQA